MVANGPVVSRFKWDQNGLNLTTKWWVSLFLNKFFLFFNVFKALILIFPVGFEKHLNWSNTCGTHQPLIPNRWINRISYSVRWMAVSRIGSFTPICAHLQELFPSDIVFHLKAEILVFFHGDFIRYFEVWFWAYCREQCIESHLSSSLWQLFITWAATS